MKLTIGDNIRKYRKQTDMTQEQLADKLGTTYQSVSRWENGSTYPDMELLPVLAGMFGVTTDALLGMPEIEKEKKADEAFDALRREALKRDIDPSAVIPIIRDIRNNYLGCENAWRLWSEGNDHCYRHPEVLPEVRLLAEAYRERVPFANSVHLLETMASVEDEEHLDEFFEKYTTAFDASERELRYNRYLRLCNSEKFEPERRYKLYKAINDILCPRTLIGWDDDTEKNRAVTGFQSAFLRLLRNHGGDEPDMWVPDRLELGINNAAYLASQGNTAAALGLLGECIFLLEKTMEITETVTLPPSCEWLDGMTWEAEERWEDRINSPDEDDQRCIFIYTQMNHMTSCNLIFPSRYYQMLTCNNSFEALKDNPQFLSLVARVKALIITRPKQKV